MSVKNITIISFLWAFLERFGAQLLQLIIYILLARLLTPSDFGLMGMLAVFVGISQSLTDSGFGQALIQKKDTDDVDYSSVFYVNLSLSVVIYILIFFAAPLIATFYKADILSDLIRVVGLRFIISAFFLVQVSRLTKELEFKKLLQSRLPATFASGFAGVVSAYAGLGVWSLVVLQLTDSLIYALQIWRQSGWRPIPTFNYHRVKNLFKFGGNMMLEGVFGSIYKNMNELIIGRYYNAAMVGFFTQANRFKQLPVDAFTSAISQVTFPILVGFQDDNVRLKNAYRQIIRQVFFMTTPIMVAAIVVAEPLFKFLLTDKWLPGVPYFQILCAGAIFYPAQVFNLNILKVKGRSDLFLYLGFVKKGIGFVAIMILASYSVMALVIFSAFFSFLAYFINSYYSGKLIQYGIGAQLADIWPFPIVGAVAGGMVFVIEPALILSDFSRVVLGASSVFFIYGFVLFLLDKKIVFETYSLIAGFYQKLK